MIDFLRTKLLNDLQANGYQPPAMVLILAIEPSNKVVAPPICQALAFLTVWSV